MKYFDNLFKYSIEQAFEALAKELGYKSKETVKISIDYITIPTDFDII